MLKMGLQAQRPPSATCVSLCDTRSFGNTLIFVVVSVMCLAPVSHGVATSVDANPQGFPVHGMANIAESNGKIKNSGDGVEPFQEFRETPEAEAGSIDEGDHGPQEDGGDTTRHASYHLNSTEAIALPKDRTRRELGGWSMDRSGRPHQIASSRWKLGAAVAAVSGLLLAASYWRFRRQPQQGISVDQLIEDAQTDYSLEYRGRPLELSSLPPEVPQSLQYESLMSRSSRYHYYPVVNFPA